MSASTVPGDPAFVLAAAARGEPQYVVDMLRRYGGAPDKTWDWHIETARKIAKDLGCEVLGFDSIRRIQIAEVGGYYRRAARSIVAVCGGECSPGPDVRDLWLDPHTHDPYRGTATT